MSKRKVKKYNKFIFIVILLGLALIFIFKFFKKENTPQVFSDTEVKEKIPIGVMPEEVYGVKVKLIPSGTEARTGQKRIIKYIVLHETDNTDYGTDAKNHATYLSFNNTSATSWHYTVDDHEIYHHIPDDERANHAANNEGNEYGIGIELCVNKNGDFDQTFDNAAKLVAYLLKAYELDIEDIKTHRDFNGKDCPHIIFKTNRLEEFKNKVEEYMNS